jgi:hypothetical protein
MRSVNAALLKALAVGIVIAVAAWVWLTLNVSDPVDVPRPAPRSESPSPPPPLAAPSGASERHPIANAEGTPFATGEVLLPPIDASDDAIASALAAVVGDVPLRQLFNLEGFARRLVATVDNLPREQLAARVAAVRPVPGIPTVANRDGTLELDERNVRRYETYMRMLDNVDTARLVGVYTHFYPLLQQAYAELGYPNRHFNDRVVEVIDHLLASPEVHPPIRLAQPKVLYVFADEDLERLSYGQKAMLRIGEANAARVKAKLREIRAALAPDRH